MNVAWPRVAWRAGACLLAMLSGPMAAFAAAGEDEQALISRAAQTVPLHFEDLPFAFFHWSLPVSERSTPFEKEPAMKPGSVVRGTLECGRNKTNRLAFAWDRGAGKLYVDLNRNLDLTDDPLGAFASADQRGSVYPTFTNVHLPVATSAGDRSTAMDLNLFGYGNRLYANAGLRSLWLGQAMLAGKEWQVGLLDRPIERGAAAGSRHLLLRPWEDREKPFQMGDGAAPVFGFSTNLFLNGHAYGLVAADAGAGDKAGINLDLTEQHPALGELKPTGQFIQRLALEGSSCLVVLEQPGSVVRVPVGRYTEANVRLGNGGVEAVRSPRVAGPGVTVSETGTAALVIGGPLTNSVNINRRGRTLVFNYQLLGAGGDAYQLVRPGARKPPEFAAYQGEAKITSGKFEFG